MHFYAMETHIPTLTQLRDVQPPESSIDKIIIGFINHRKNKQESEE